MVRVTKLNGLVEVKDLTSTGHPNYINMAVFAFEIKGNAVELHSEYLEETHSIPFELFEDADGNPLSTEEQITNYLTNL